MGTLDTGRQETEHAHGRAEGERKYWLDEPRHVNCVCYALYIICVLLALLDFTWLGFHFYHKHIHFEFENPRWNFEDWFGFFGLFGFVACVGLVLTAQQMRKVLRREEDYYEP